MRTLLSTAVVGALARALFLHRSGHCRGMVAIVDHIERGAWLG